MAYFPPYIDESGLHIPTYTDVRDQLIEDAKTIFGSDIYLENDSQDYQFIANMAEKIYDSYQLSQLIYNNRSPKTATGTALDSIVKLNGLARLPGTKSTAIVTIAGTTGTIIVNGVVSDTQGNKWDLPASVEIPIAGNIDVTATAQEYGSIVANIGEIIYIDTPTFGWNSVTNSTAAVTGTYAETDAQLRARQAVSVAKPSLSLLEGTKAGIAEVIGVARYKVYENDADAPDSDGFPEHSITSVVEGGTDADIAEAIFRNKGIGGYTNGDVVVNYVDQQGQITPIRFYRPIYVDIDVQVDVVAIQGYTSQTTEDIKAAIETYLNSLQIGTDVVLSVLYGVALSAMQDLKNPTFSVTQIQIAVHLDPLGTSDIVIDAIEVARGDTANITVNVS